ncbi:MAG: fibronectin type III domain-containing protein [Oscillospiraceae bacterium]|nr:fibronectin type III domain-containing protein [Oscillospiraceae bacterium]
MIIEAMGTPLVSICVAAYEPTQWLGAQDNGFTRNRRAVFSPNVGTRLYMFGGVADGQTLTHAGGIAGTPSRFWPFPGLQNTDLNRLRDVDFNSLADFAPAAAPTFNFTRAAARWDVNRDANAFGSRLPAGLAAQLDSIPMNPITGLPTGAWNTRIEMILNASDPLATDNAMNMHQDIYRMATLTPVEQMLWAFLYCDPPAVRGENLSWYYSTAHMFAPRQRYLTVSGANESEVLRNFQAMAGEMMFGDGTALLIPTRELVDEMLATTNLGPDDLIGYIKMRGGAMTAETLAANAVMAGVEPEAFPVLIALAQTLTMAWEEDGHQWHAMTTASQPLSLGAVVSGPITEAIGMENEINMVGSGNTVNATLSRAFRLFYNNVAGNISGHIDTSGRTTRLNDLILVVIPENYTVTRALGWETHAEMMGFSAGSSTVSLIPWVQGTGTGGPSMETAFADPAAGAWDATRTWQRNAGFAGADIGIAFFSPAHAAELAVLDGGITKTELIQGWAVLPGTPAAPAATAYVTVNGLRAGEADRFAGMMTSGAQAGRVLARFPIVVGPASGASFVAAGEGPFYRAGVWSTAVISGTSAAPAVIQNAQTSPSAPQNVQVSTDATARTATLTWDAPAFDGNGVIEGYEVFMYHGGVMTTFDWIAVPGGAAARSFTFENLVPGEQYHFRVRAHNDVISNIYYINRQHNGHIVSGMAGVPNEFWLDLERTRGRGAWGRATCATRTAYANAADIAEGLLTAADVTRGVRPIRSHVAVPGAVRPPEITAALQNLTYIHAPRAFYTVRLPQNIPFEVLPPHEMTYFALPQIRFRPGGDFIPQALLDFWAERGFVIGDFTFEAFNNGNENNESLAEAGLIRVWPLLGGASVHVPSSAIITAYDPDGNDAMEFITLNRLWCDDEGWLEYYVNFDADKNAQWQYIDLTVTVFRQTAVIRLVNNRFVPQVFDLRAFNNGTCEQVPDLAGRIRIWPQLDGIGAPIPMSAMITAVDQDNNDALQWITRNRQWVDGVGFRDYYVNFDVTKDAPWQYITLTVRVFGQTVELLLINNLFVVTPVDVLSLNAFNNGNDNNASLANAGIIRIWTRLNGVNALVRYDDLTVTAAHTNGGDCAMEFVRINRIWNNMDYVNLIDVTKNNAPWQYIDLTVTLGNQTVELLLINNTYLG